MPGAPDQNRLRQIELILQQIEGLPTLSPVAARLLRVSSAADADLDDIVLLIESDPALTARILGLCRRADRPVLDRVTTVRRAVVMLGLEAVQSAVLSVNVYDLMDSAGAGADDPEPAPSRFDRRGFWKHCIASAAASELIAESHARLKVRPEEAFVAGLLHDVGKLALDLILPRAFSRVLELAERRRCGSASVELELLGIDHHTTGKRLAEHWGLPHALQDVMWLHGQGPATVPEVAHKPHVAVVSVGEALARSLHLGWSGDFDPAPSMATLCREHGLDTALVEQAGARLPALVVDRCKLLGIDDRTTPELLMEALASANRQLGRLNALLQARSRAAERQSRVIGAIQSFHEDRRPGRTLVDALSDVARATGRLMGPGFCAVIFQARADDPNEPWELCQFTSQGAVRRTQIIDPPKRGGSSLARLADPEQLSISALSLLPWLTDYLAEASDIRNVRLLTLTPPHPQGPVAVLLHEASMEELHVDRALLTAIVGTWGAAIVAAAAHDGARRLGERLAASHRSLAEAQNKLTEAQSLVRLGEMAAGAAHEMNNPLTVISGRSQILAGSLRNDADRDAAQSIVEAAQHLTDLITSLRLLSDPPRPRPQPVPLDQLVADATQRAERRTDVTGTVRAHVPSPVPVALVDRELIAMALSEAVVNAVEASQGKPIDIRVHRDGSDGRLLIAVEDKGTGMSARTLQHAFDPFYSDKPAGRQTGLGLARARRLVELHGGSITLRSSPGEGTTATFTLPGAGAGMAQGAVAQGRAVGRAA